MDVSRETRERLQIYLDLLERWNRKINLVSNASLADGWVRHILDSAQLPQYAPADWRHWADLGSGGGLPGIVIAVLARELPGHREVTLVESDARKAAFLQVALHETGSPGTVARCRIEDLAPLSADVISARALAPLPRLLDLASRHLADGGTALLLKGRNADSEIEEALERWTFACEKMTSETDPAAVILRIGELGRA